MESLINYESDDGQTKNTKRHRSRESNDKAGQNTKGSSQRKHRSRSSSSSSSDSGDDDKRKRLTEEKLTSKSLRKRSDKHYRNSSSRDNDRHHRRSSSRDNDRHHRKSSSKDNDRKRKYEDRDDKSRKYGKGERRDSREKEGNRHRDSSGERRREKYDRRETERRSDDRRERDRDGRDIRNNRDKYERNDRYKDDHHRRRNDSSRDGKDSDNNHSSSEPKESNSLNALRKAEALNRTIERRANEKVQQLQKLGIEIPAMIQHQQQQQQQQQQLLLQQQLQTKIQTAQMRALSMASMLTHVPNTIMSQTTEPHSTNDGNSDDNNLNLNLTNFTSPVLANARYTEQMQKKKLIWGAKKAAATNCDTVTTNNKWEAAKFSQDSDGKMASKFLRLMGMKNVPATVSNSTDSNATETTNGSDIDPSVEKREQMFSKMEQQYEIARQTTHTMRGMGLGFGSQSRPC